MDGSRFDRMTRRVAARRLGLASLATAAAIVAGAFTRQGASAITYCGNSGPCHTTPGMCGGLDLDGDGVPDGCVCCAARNRVTGQITNSRCATACGTPLPILVP